MRKLMVLAAAPLMAVLVSAPAAAMSKAQADCPYETVGQDFAYELVGVIMAEDEGSPKIDAMSAKVDDVGEQCAAKLKISKGQADLYGKFTRARIAYFGIVQRLSERGIPAKAIDDALGFGPGRGNPATSDLTEDQFQNLIDGLGKAGVDTAKLSEEDWGWVGAYIGVTGEMYRLMDEIK